MVAWAWDRTLGPFAGGPNPFLRSGALVVAPWAARPHDHLWG